MSGVLEVVDAAEVSGPDASTVHATSSRPFTTKSCWIRTARTARR